MSKRELEALTRRYVAEIIDAIGPEKDVPAPDVNTNDQVMAWVMDTYSMHVGHTETAVVTGKPIEMGGSLGRREATGRGVMIVTREAAKHLGLRHQGRDRRRPGLRQRRLGLGGPARRHRREDRRGHRLEGRRLQPEGARHREAARATSSSTRRSTASPAASRSTNEELLGLDVDVLIPAALENQITMENAPRIKAKILTEGANGPTTPEAHKLLHERGVFVIPDILANAGGVTDVVLRVGAGPLRLLLGADEVNTRLEKKMGEAFDDVLQTSLKYKVDLRTAAYIVAISRVGHRHQDARDVRVMRPAEASPYVAGAIRRRTIRRPPAGQPAS